MVTKNEAVEQLPTSDEEVGGEARAERLREAIKAAGGRQLVADRIGIPVSTIAGYLRGGEMKLSNAAAIARATGVRLEWLALGTGPKHEAPHDAAMESGVMETGAEPPPLGARTLFASVDMDLLAAAHAAALAVLHANGHHNPEPRRVVQVMALLYDRLAISGDLTASLRALSQP